MRTFLLLIFIVLSQNTKAQNNFDFWVGNWDVYSTASNNLIGENQIKKILDDKVIFENWSDVRGFKGKSFTLFDSIQNIWKQTWVDNKGAITEFKGILKNDTIVFLTDSKKNNENKIEANRMTIIKKSNNEVLQTGEVSFDNSKSWQTTYSFRYLKRSEYLLNHNKFSLKIYGVKIKVKDLELAKRFYTETLGFNIDNSVKNNNQIQLYTNSIKIILELDETMIILPIKSISQVSLTMQVNDLDETYKILTKKGITFLSDKKRKEGVGFSMKIFDPFGNQISLLQQTTSNTPQIVEPKIYNCGYYISNMGEARKFYTSIIGFIELTNRYLPDDMPLSYSDKTFAFILHKTRKEFNHFNTENMKIVFFTDDINSFLKTIQENNINHSVSKNVVLFTDDSGIQSEVFFDK